MPYRRSLSRNEYAKLQDYEPVDFWGDNEDEAKA